MYEYKAKVIKVVDGDTIDVTLDLGFDIFLNERIRLHGINCPESRTSDKAEKVKGLASKAFTESKLPVGKDIVLLSKTFSKEKFGRILADIIVDGINLNEALIDVGLAMVFMADTNK
jgi:micrococcal nuclease